MSAIPFKLVSHVSTTECPSARIKGNKNGLNMYKKIKKAHCSTLKTV
jgi:hypothetical protein